MAGIRIAPDSGRADALVTLAIISGLPSSSEYISRMDLWLGQAVRLRRDGAVLSFAKTWDEGYLLYDAEGKYKDAILRYTNLLADRFVNAFLAVNPK